ncbi:winged helix-turn-helix transcriptional regulator [Undibacterium fentianense]|uniref:Helix-turn-helix transcriptional regulator n=1 Tax=Undibacterium fentianense TaxID=2828728 RepID=A0A941E431_9BURK|nr:helix-turn-helix domain-containing protein [Undibacterium fentianense]MBR7800651.1 helix-turn-helix transcriptional regulator [Undibacterium fentianense]
MLEKPIQACPVARAAHLIGDEWILLILRELFKRAHKFDELQKATGAASNILTNRLKRMVEAKIVLKIPYQDRPVRFQYKLSDAGLALLPLTLELMRYGEDWLPCPSPSTFRLRHLDCGEITRAGQVCSACGGALHVKNVRMEDNPAAMSDRQN